MLGDDDLDGLRAWLGLELGLDLVDMAPLGEGHSNLTFSVRTTTRDLVLRRPPYGPLLPTAHDVVREHQVVSMLAVSGCDVRVAEPVAVSEDVAVMGAPFALFARIDGDVVRDAVPSWLESHALRRTLGLDLAGALGEIHVVPWQPFVEAGIGRPSGYLERQLRRWTGQREGVQTAVEAAGGHARDLPDYDAVRDWLRRELPADVEPSVVHGDYKLDNAIVGPDGRVRAVVDWEMATVGDPRTDLGYLLSCWPEPGETMPLMQLPSSEPGFPCRAELVAEWEQRTGRVAGDTTWFMTLAAWKLAILLEASYHRWLAGMTDDPFFARLETGVPALLAQARETCGA